MLEKVSPAERRRLTAALGEAELLLGGAAAERPAAPYVLRPPRIGDMGLDSSIARPRSTRGQHLAGMGRFKRSSPKLSPPSFATSTSGASAAGSPNATARLSVLSFSCAAGRAPQSSACFMSKRRRAVWASAVAWSTNAFFSPAIAVMSASRCGPTTFLVRRGASTRLQAFVSSPKSRITVSATISSARPGTSIFDESPTLARRLVVK